MIGGQLVQDVPQWYYIKGVLEGESLLGKSVSIHKGCFLLLINLPLLKATRSVITGIRLSKYTFPKLTEARSRMPKRACMVRTM